MERYANASRRTRFVVAVLVSLTCGFLVNLVQGSWHR